MRPVQVRLRPVPRLCRRRLALRFALVAALLALCADGSVTRSAVAEAGSTATPATASDVPAGCAVPATPGSTYTRENSALEALRSLLIAPYATANAAHDAAHATAARTMTRYAARQGYAEAISNLAVANAGVMEAAVRRHDATLSPARRMLRRDTSLVATTAGLHWTLTSPSGTHNQSEYDWGTTGVSHCCWRGVMCQAPAEADGQPPVSGTVDAARPPGVGDAEASSDLGVVQLQVFNASTVNASLPRSWRLADATASYGNGGGGSTTARPIVPVSDVVDTLAQLSSLRQLTLWALGIGGTLPDSVSQLAPATLRTLALDLNELHGTLPDALWDLAQLEVLTLSENPSLRGGISGDGVARIPWLTHIDVGMTSMGGPLPMELFTATQAAYLSVYHAAFTGSIPASALSAAAPHLRFLDTTGARVWGNPGTLPAALWDAANLTHLYVENCSLASTIPALYGTPAHASVDTLMLSRNKLQGDLPRGLFDAPNLRELRVANNALTARLRSHDIGMSSLEVFDGSFNSFTGNALPNGACNMGSTLREWLVGGNTALGGTFPECFFTALPRLKKLHAQFTSIKGPLPPCRAGEAPSLSHLHLFNARMSGAFPATLPPKLKSMLVGDNAFTGHLPANLSAQVPDLEYLNVADNQLEGEIATAVEGLRNLKVLFMSYNDFMGPLPRLATLPALQQLEAQSNDFNNDNVGGRGIPELRGAGPDLAIINVRFNAFRGPLPDELLLLGNITQSYWDNNWWSGEWSAAWEAASAEETMPLVARSNLTVVSGSLFGCPLPQVLSQLDTFTESYLCGYTDLQLSVTSILACCAAYLVAVVLHARWSIRSAETRRLGAALAAAGHVAGRRRGARARRAMWHRTARRSRGAAPRYVSIGDGSDEDEAFDDLVLGADAPTLDNAELSVWTVVRRLQSIVTTTASDKLHNLRPLVVLDAAALTEATWAVRFMQRTAVFCTGGAAMALLATPVYLYSFSYFAKRFSLAATIAYVYDGPVDGVMGTVILAAFPVVGVALLGSWGVAATKRLKAARTAHASFGVYDDDLSLEASAAVAGGGRTRRTISGAPRPDLRAMNASTSTHAGAGASAGAGPSCSCCCRGAHGAGGASGRRIQRPFSWSDVRRVVTASIVGLLCTLLIALPNGLYVYLSDGAQVEGTTKLAAAGVLGFVKTVINLRFVPLLSRAALSRFGVLVAAAGSGAVAAAIGHSTQEDRHAVTASGHKRAAAEWGSQGNDTAVRGGGWGRSGAGAAATNVAAAAAMERIHGFRTLCVVTTTMQMVNTWLVPIASVLLLHENCLLWALNPLPADVLTVVDKVCVVSNWDTASGGGCWESEDIAYTSIIPFRYSYDKYCPSTVLRVYGPVWVWALVAQGMIGSAYKMLIRTYGEHSPVRGYIGCRTRCKRRCSRGRQQEAPGWEWQPQPWLHGVADEIAGCCTCLLLCMGVGVVYPAVAVAAALGAWATADAGARVVSIAMIAVRRRSQRSNGGGADFGAGEGVAMRQTGLRRGNSTAAVASAHDNGAGDVTDGGTDGIGIGAASAVGADGGGAAAASTEASTRKLYEPTRAGIAGGAWTSQGVTRLPVAVVAATAALAAAFLCFTFVGGTIRVNGHFHDTKPLWVFAVVTGAAIAMTAVAAGREDRNAARRHQEVLLRGLSAAGGLDYQ